MMLAVKYGPVFAPEEVPQQELRWRVSDLRKQNSRDLEQPRLHTACVVQAWAYRLGKRRFSFWGLRLKDLLPAFGFLDKANSGSM